ncbi:MULTISPECIES: HdeD family acid-resistance protein [Vagococcus]|uniref:HdeD family acid-resistance protein n=1 Tax=Vagococcus TaxID=2737 RepID=UPI000E51F66B|nr:MULTISPECIES: DUF308 domain-containing protein [Vagococcus]RHH70189.1 hypothetical protein DW196_05345 [Vagococcus sp. AM17-17]
MSNERNGFDWFSFLLGILFIFASLTSFQDPTGNLVAIVVVFGMFAIIKGIFELFLRKKVREFTGISSTMPIIIGVFDVIVGIFLLFNISAGVIALPFVFAIWFLLDSFVGLFSSGALKKSSTGYYWFSIVINILGVIVGFMLLVNPVSSALTLSFLVGFYFMMFGITEITYAFR